MNLIAMKADVLVRAPRILMIKIQRNVIFDFGKRDSTLSSLTAIRVYRDCTEVEAEVSVH
jgi:hypothetical protein